MRVVAVGGGAIHALSIDNGMATIMVDSID